MNRNIGPRLAVVLCMPLVMLAGALQAALATDPGERLDELMAEHGAVGLAVVVVRDNAVVHADSRGWKDLDARIPLERDDLFRIASISKSFVASSILQLVEQGRMSLEDDVGELLGFPVRNPRFPERAISVRMLLNHTSSITDSQRYHTLDLINPAVNDTWAASYSEHAPGEHYQYSNLGYNMAGAIVERVSGTRFDLYVREHILEPLGLDGGHWPDALDPERFAQIYRWHDDQGFVRSDAAYAPLGGQLAGYRMGYSAPLFSPTGGLKISALDLARYMLMHMNLGEWDGVRVLSPGHAGLMQSPSVEIDADGGYGLALRTDRALIPGVALVGHTGSAYGLYSSMFFDPVRKYGFVVITTGARDPEVRTAVNRWLHQRFIEGGAD